MFRVVFLLRHSSSSLSPGCRETIETVTSQKKLVASCVEPKVFGGTRISGQLNPVNHQLHDVAPKVFTFNFMAGSLILNKPISTMTKKV